MTQLESQREIELLNEKLGYRNIYDILFNTKVEIKTYFHPKAKTNFVLGGISPEGLIKLKQVEIYDPLTGLKKSSFGQDETARNAIYLYYGIIEPKLTSEIIHQMFQAKGWGPYNTQMIAMVEAINPKPEDRIANIILLLAKNTVERSFVYKLKEAGCLPELARTIANVDNTPLAYALCMDLIDALDYVDMKQKIDNTTTEKALIAISKTILLSRGFPEEQLRTFK